MRAAAWVEVVRPVNVLALAAATAVGARLSGASGFSAILVVPALVAAFGYARNDSIDTEPDIRNHPRRPIPTGRLTKGEARALGWGCLAAAAALMLAAHPSPRFYGLFALAAALLYAYSPWLKDRGAWGPVTVTVLSGLAVVWGSWLGPHPERAVAAALVAASVTFARECAKDLADLEGDRAAGRGTWPARAGEARVQTAVRAASAAGLLALPLPWLHGDVTPAYAFVAMGVGAPLLLRAIWKAPADQASARASSVALKATLYAGVAGLWLGAPR
ncbi:MAG: UbiA family prenyltransferase [Candidatus Latescibacteria bacterium]|nr:UbiA family prenyltransferase [Candidatus Latescibacterota bacterium]